MNQEDKILELLLNLQAGMGRMETNIAEINVHLGTVDANIGEMKNNINRLNVRMDNLETRMDNLETRIDTMDVQIKTLRHDLEVIHGSVIKIEIDHGEQLGGIWDALTLLRESTDFRLLNQQISNHEERIIALERAAG